MAEFPVSCADVDRAAAEANGPEPWEIAAVFWRKHEAHAGAPDAAAAWDLLARVMSFPFQSRNASHPYGDNSGGLTAEQAAELELLAPNINTLEVRARFSDVAWTRKRGNPAMARLAVASYLDVARTREDAKNWVATMQRVERAARLARSLGRDNESFQPVAAYLHELVDKHRGEDPLFLTGKAIELMLEFGLNSHPKLLGYANTAAKRAVGASNFHLARYYLNLLARIHGEEGNVDGRNDALKEIAQTFEAEAAQRESRDEAFAASILLNQAIEAHRRAPEPAARVEAIRPKLQRAERAAISQFRKIEIPLDVGKFATAAREAISGKTKKEAIIHIAHIHNIAMRDEVRQQALEIAARFPLQNLVGGRIVDNQGRTVGMRPGMSPGGATNGQDDAILARMVEQVSFARRGAVPAVIYPAFLQLVFEHDIDWQDMFGLASYSPFVPQDRVQIFTDGLHAGFEQDFLSAVHLLVPQIENSIRHLMQSKAMITTKLDQYGIQREIDFNELVVDPRAAEAISADVLFDLRCLCTDNRGPNLRNRLAHGLLPDGEFFSPDAIYAWWLVLRMCIFSPAVKPLQSTTGGGGPPVENSGVA